MILCVVPFCNKDSAAAIDLLHWINELGGCSSYDCLLVVDAATDWSQCKQALDLACQGFRTAKLVHTDQTVSGWPQGPNALLLRASQHALEIGQPFLFLEPDAIPLKQGWLDQLSAEYSDGYLGCIYRFQNPRPPFLPFDMMSGVAIYPPSALNDLAPFIKGQPDTAWDVSCAQIMTMGKHTKLIQQYLGTRKEPPTFVDVKTADSPAVAVTMELLRPESVIFHRNKDGSLLQKLRQRASYLPKLKRAPGAEVQTCIHGGDVGDLIYGLCAMKAIGAPIRLVLHPHPVREQFTPLKVSRLAPLLIQQSFIEEVAFEEVPPKTRWNFNPFREYNWNRRANRLESLCQSQHRIFHLPEDGIIEPWIDVDYGLEIPGKPVVIHRSPRYHNHFFPWAEIHRRYKDKAVFVGMPDEHQAFCKEVGPLPHHRTENYLDLARIIAGATLFIGNQSAPYAIAEGLKQNAILEAMPGCNDCMFCRENLANDVRGQFLLPDI